MSESSVKFRVEKIFLSPSRHHATLRSRFWKRVELAKFKRKPWIKLSDAFPMCNGGRFIGQTGSAGWMDQLEPSVLTNMPVFCSGYWLIYHRTMCKVCICRYITSYHIISYHIISYHIICIIICTISCIECISIYYNIYIYIHMIVCRDASLYKRPRHPLKCVQGPGPSGPRFLFPDGMLLECIINVNVLGNTYPLVNVNQKRTGKIHHAIFGPFSLCLDITRGYKKSVKSD